MDSKCDLMNVIQFIFFVCLGSPIRPCSIMIRRTVCQETDFLPSGSGGKSFMISPWMWPYPQEGFSLFILRTSSRIWLAFTALGPHLPEPSYFRATSNLCHRIKVS